MHLRIVRVLCCINNTEIRNSKEMLLTQMLTCVGHWLSRHHHGVWLMTILILIGLAAAADKRCMAHVHTQERCILGTWGVHAWLVGLTAPSSWGTIVIPCASRGSMDISVGQFLTWKIDVYMSMQPSQTKIFINQFSSKATRITISNFVCNSECLS